MRSTATLAAQLQHSTGWPETLPAAVAAFEVIQQLARQHETADADLFAAFMTTAGSAADGLEALTAIQATALLPASTPSHDLADHPERAADAIAGLAAVLEVALDRAGTQASDSEIKIACQDAARSAREIQDLMASR